MTRSDAAPQLRMTSVTSVPHAYSFIRTSTIEGTTCSPFATGRDHLVEANELRDTPDDVWDDAANGHGGFAECSRSSVLNSGGA